MSIEALKEQARRHEQKEQWGKALDLYTQALDRMADDQFDVGLFNRAGDLNTRLDRLGPALVMYNKAIDLYLESELPNNAIAVCKKVIRNVPHDAACFLRMGQIRADQGFMVDARANYISYAEKVDQDEALRALEEFADRASDDHEIRLLLAAQMEQVDRNTEAAKQLVKAFHVMNGKGLSEEAAALQSRIQELDPEVSMGPETVVAPLEAAAEALDDLVLTMAGDDDSSAALETDFGDFEIGGDDAAAEVEEDTAEAGAEAGAGAEAELGGFELATDDEVEEPEDDETPLPMMSFDDEEKDDAEALPTFSMDDGDAAEKDAEPLPTFSMDDGDAAESDAEVVDELPLMSFEDDEDDVTADDAVAAEPVSEASDALESAIEEAEAEPAAADGHESLADSGDFMAAIDALDADISASPDDIELRQRRVEYAFRVNDGTVLSVSYFGLATALETDDQQARAKAVYQQAVQADGANADAATALARLEGGEAAAPAAATSGVASTDDYIDLGAMILDSDDEEKSTRFVVAYEEPSGDEAADFSKMLAQFKEKVSESIDADDVTAHYDLGTAYKEMGLLDEAIHEFQMALRASVNHLGTYEMLGQTFIEKGEHEAAVRSLTRALDVDFEVEDELIGIYYYLGQAHEALENTDSAIEFFDRVFTLDINFADVTDRLRALRS